MYGDYQPSAAYVWHRPVAGSAVLLALASYGGAQLLVRLCFMRDIPHELKSLLADNHIAKVVMGRCLNRHNLLCRTGFRNDARALRQLLVHVTPIVDVRNVCLRWPL